MSGGGAREMLGEDFVGGWNATELALKIRREVNSHPLIGKYFRIASNEDMIPAEFRPSKVTEYGRPHSTWKDVLDAWDNDEFVKAVKKTGRKQLIVAGLVTDVCVAEVALSATRAGYQVFVAIDASGTTSTAVRDTTIVRMSMGGVTPINWFAIASQLMRDWRNDEEGFAAILSALERFPDYRRASTEGGLSQEEFDTFPPTRRTLRQFITACHDLDAQIRELMLPNPDLTGS